MVDLFLDDVNELLLKEKGDPKILKRIQRAAEGEEVISVYERAYVKQLVEKHLRPLPEGTQTKEIQQETQIKSETNIIPGQPRTTSKITKPSKPMLDSKKENQKTTKIMLGIGAIALAIILVVGISITNVSDDFSQPDNLPPTETGPIGPLTIETDLSSYELEDIISISGTVEITGENIVEVSIENPVKKVIWKEELKVKNNGEFSTLVIAGGSGWETSGEYVLKAKHGSLFKEIPFTIKA